MARSALHHHRAIDHGTRVHDHQLRGGITRMHGEYEGDGDCGERADPAWHSHPGIDRG
jgi:hypothetical protein